MDEKMDIELRLWDYIDGNCSAAEQTLIEQLIAENKEWRDKYSELLDVDQTIGALELEQPSLRFSKNVMEEITKLQIAPATKSYINNKIIYSIAAFFLILIGGALVYLLSQVNWSSGSSFQNPVAIDFTNVDYSQVFNSSYVSIFMMINVILGLMLLDRYLNNKKKKLADKVS